MNTYLLIVALQRANKRNLGHVEVGYNYHETMIVIIKANFCAFVTCVTVWDYLCCIRTPPFQPFTY